MYYKDLHVFANGGEDEEGARRAESSKLCEVGRHWEIGAGVSVRSQSLRASRCCGQVVLKEERGLAEVHKLPAGTSSTRCWTFCLQSTCAIAIARASLALVALPPRDCIPPATASPPAAALLVARIRTRLRPLVCCVRRRLRALFEALHQTFDREKLVPHHLNTGV